MALTATQVFDVVAPAYKNHHDKDAWLEIAEEMISSDPKVWSGTIRSRAVALQAAHSLTLTETRPMGEGGTVTQKQEGRLVIGYEKDAGTSSKYDRDLGQTHFGRQLIGLMRRSIAPMTLTGGLSAGVSDGDY